MLQNTLLPGFAGGLLPTLLVIGTQLAKSNTTKIDIGLGIILGGMILGIIGGIVAWAFSETDRRKAFTMGVSAPALLASLITSASNNTNPPIDASKTASMNGAFSLISSARAQSVAPELPTINQSQTSIPNRSISLENNDALPITAELLDEKGNILAAYLVSGKGRSIPIPDTATSLAFKHGRDTLSECKLSTVVGSNTEYNLNTKSKKRLGFAQAFGVPATTEVTLKVKETVTSAEEGLKGWISPGSIPAPKKPTGTNFTTDRALLVYADNDTRKAIGTIPSGTTLNIRESTDEGWKKIEILDLKKPH